MFKFEIPCKIINGVLSLNSDSFNRLTKSLNDGDAKLTVELLPKPKTIEEFRAWYFAMRDLVAAESGNSKEDVHEWAKGNFNNGLSTKLLDEISWRGFIEDFKKGAFEHFNVYL